MDSHVLEYFKESSGKDPAPGTYHRVIPLHAETDLLFDDLKALMPTLNRGWYELSRLSVEDRIEFTRDFWMSRLPYHPELAPFLMRFFSNLDDIGIFLTQRVYQQPFEAHMVYSLKGDEGFFQGNMPISDEELIHLTQQFPTLIFPADYSAFLRIHNGFAKQDDIGIVPAERLHALREHLKAHLEGTLLASKGVPVDPAGLIPFYESDELGTYQCFWDDWYPDQEMGNVYLSEISGTISDTTDSKRASETMAFPTFLDWLMFYLERVE